MAKKRNSLPFHSERVTYYVKHIQANWAKAADSILEVSRLCAEANRELSPQDKADLREVLQFSSAMFSKLAKIGADQRLQKPTMQKLLPPNYSIIYEVSRLDNPGFQRVVDAGLLRPDVTRNEIQQHSIRPVSSNPKAGGKPTAFFAELRLVPTARKETVEAVEAALNAIRKQHGVEIVWPTSLPANQRIVQAYGRALLAYQATVTRKMVTVLKARIRVMKREAKRRNKPFGYNDSELDLDCFVVDATETDPRIREVIEILGQDEAYYESVKREAERLVSRSRINRALKKQESVPFLDCGTDFEFDATILDLPRKGRRSRTAQKPIAWKLD